MGRGVPGFPKPNQAPDPPRLLQGVLPAPHPPPAYWPNSAGLGWGGGEGQAPVGPQSCTMAHLGPCRWLQDARSPPVSPRAIYTQGTWPPDRRGLMEPRASREELACDRRWLRWRWGNQRAGTASPSRPAVCFACGMALRKGEAPRTPSPLGLCSPHTWLGSGKA